MEFMYLRDSEKKTIKSMNVLNFRLIYWTDAEQM